MNLELLMKLEGPYPITAEEAWEFYREMIHTPEIWMLPWYHLELAGALLERFAQPSVVANKLN